MSNVDIPPKPYFNGINFNPSFFSTVLNYLTEAIANTKYLMLNGLNFMTGNLGIKRSPQVELDVNGKAIIHTGLGGVPVNGIYGGDGTRLVLWPGAADDTAYALGISATTMWYGVPSTANHRFYTGTNERLRIKNDGYVGIGTNDPGNILQVGSGGRLRIANSENDYSVIGTRNVDDNTLNTKILLNGNTYTGSGTAGSIQYFATGTGMSHIFYGGPNERLRIRNDGNVGIGTGNPANILQIGNGGRLRISNSENDYSVIGTRNVDDNTLNTKILLNGNTYTGSSAVGSIQYFATTATGKHIFYVNGTTALVDWDNTDCTFYNSITTIGANYYTDGEYIPHSPKTNTAGVLKNGYFIYLGYFFNSLLNIALSHNDSTYTYWHGNIGTNNSTAPIYITALAQNNATIESFQEQTTNIYWIYFRPTSSYNASVQLRVKFYG